MIFQVRRSAARTKGYRPAAEAVVALRLRFGDLAAWY
jgi:hypothetical protein